MSEFEHTKVAAKSNYPGDLADIQISNDMGKKGWELCAVIEHSTTVILYFKREKTSDKERIRLLEQKNQALEEANKQLLEFRNGKVGPEIL